MKTGRVPALILALVLLAGIAWLCWPQPMSGLIDWEKAVQLIRVSASGQEDAVLSLGVSDQVFEPGSEGHAALKALLSSFRWRRGIGSLFEEGMTGILTKERLQLHELSDRGRMLETVGGSARIAIDGRAARLGCWGSGEADRLTQGLLGLLNASAIETEVKSP